MCAVFCVCVKNKNKSKIHGSDPTSLGFKNLLVLLQFFYNHQIIITLSTFFVVVVVFMERREVLFYSFQNHMVKTSQLQRLPIVQSSYLSTCSAPSIHNLFSFI